MKQMALDLVPVVYSDGSQVIFQQDGYINATQAAAHFGKKVNDFLRLPSTTKKINQVREKLALQENQVVSIVMGAPSNGGGTWFHPKLAVAFAAWLDDDFAWWCDEQIEKIIRGDIPQRDGSMSNLLERIRYNPVPIGMPYFSIFRESLDVMQVLAEQGTLPCDSHFMLDSSIGIRWAKHWQDSNLGLIYGERKRYEHRFPPSYPQSRARGVEPWVYPNAALPVFRDWLHTVYLDTGIKQYLKGQVGQGKLAAQSASRMLESLSTH